MHTLSIDLLPIQIDNDGFATLPDLQEGELAGISPPEYEFIFKFKCALNTDIPQRIKDEICLKVASKCL
jgi:hypothetical protein